MSLPLNQGQEMAPPRACGKCGRTGVTVREMPVSFQPGVKRRVCGECLRREGERDSLVLLSLIVIPALALGIWKWRAGKLPPEMEDLWHVCGIYGVIVGISFVMVWIHESAHAAAARWMGMPVLGLSLGWGKRLWRWKRGNFFIDFHLIPTMGVCWYQIKDRAARRRRAVVIAAGPAVHALVVVLILLSGLAGDLEIPQGTWTAQKFWSTVLWINALMFALNMIPFNLPWNSTHVGTDGKQLLALLRKPKVKAAPVNAWLMGRIEELHSLADQGRWAEVQSAGRGHLQSAEAKHPPAWASIGAWVAVADVWSGQPQDLGCFACVRVPLDRAAALPRCAALWPSIIRRRRHV